MSEPTTEYHDLSPAGDILGHGHRPAASGDVETALWALVERTGCLVCGQSTVGHKPPSMLCHDCTDARYMEDALPMLRAIRAESAGTLDVERLADWMMDNLPRVHRWMMVGWRETMRDEAIALMRDAAEYARLTEDADKT